ncbi:MAG TPA: cohesin domain-containing protein [Chloroflexota bacterium]|nr:cohesin domain-containing protein [Chloroflexota bacterium]
MTPTATSTATPTPTGITFGLNPTTSQHVVGDIFQITIQVATGSQQIDGAEVHITFDPTKLQVTDAAGNPVAKITPNTTSLELTLSNNVNNTTGQIDYVAGTLQSPLPSGNITLATITFKAIAATPAGATPLTFLTSGPGTVTRVTFGGSALPVTVSPGSVTIQ